MIARIRGVIVHKSEGHIIIETGGIGYKVRVTDKVINTSLSDQETILYTELIVRQDLLQLFGFSSPIEAELFRLLISVSHIGPQTGLSIINKLSIPEIYSAIFNKKTDVLAKVPGLGKKGAERIILELQNKISDVITEHDITDDESVPMQDALLALISLGYSRDEAERALLTVRNEINQENSTDIVKKALVELRKK